MVNPKGMVRKWYRPVSGTEKAFYMSIFEMYLAPRNLSNIASIEPTRYVSFTVRSFTVR